MSQHLKELEKTWAQIDDAKQRLHECQREPEYMVIQEELQRLRTKEKVLDGTIVLFVDPEEVCEKPKQEQQEECCESCKFWLFLYDTPIGDHGSDCTGNCMRFPPTIEGVDEYEGNMFILTYGSTLCGEYQSMPATGPLRSCD